MLTSPYLLLTRIPASRPLLPTLDRLRGHTRGNGVGGNVLDDHGARRDDGTVANGHPGSHDDVGTKPHVIAYRDVFCGVRLRANQVSEPHTVIRAVDHRSGTHPQIIADRNRRIAAGLQTTQMVDMTVPAYD